MACCIIMLAWTLCALHQLCVLCALALFRNVDDVIASRLGVSALTRRCRLKTFAVLACSHECGGHGCLFMCGGGEEGDLPLDSHRDQPLRGFAAV